MSTPLDKATATPPTTPTAISPATSPATSTATSTAISANMPIPITALARRSMPLTWTALQNNLLQTAEFPYKIAEQELKKAADVMRSLKKDEYKKQRDSYYTDFVKKHKGQILLSHLEQAESYINKVIQNTVRNKKRDRRKKGENISKPSSDRDKKTSDYLKNKESTVSAPATLKQEVKDNRGDELYTDEVKTPAGDLKFTNKSLTVYRLSIIRFLSYGEQVIDSPYLQLYVPAALG